MKKIVGLWIVFLIHIQCFSQVDTTYVYNTSTPYGTLDIRIAKSATRYYYLEENKTISFRESAPGVRTNTYLNMTSWDSNPYSEGNMREKNGNSDAFVMNYRLLFPSNYVASYASGYPLIVMMHGVGERGNCWNAECYHATSSWNPNSNTPAAPTNPDSKLMNNDRSMLHGGKVYLDARNFAGSKLPDDPTLSARAFPGFVLFPQNLNGWTGGTVQDAIRLIRLVAKKYNIDENKIYIHGLSNGGNGVFEALKRAPWLFTAAITMSAVGDAGINNQNLAGTIAHIPMWMFQGGIDTNPTTFKTQGMIKKFREAGAIVRYTLYPELGHGTWNNAYKEADFFRWMLQKSKADIHLFAGSSTICLTNGQGARMELAPGFHAYQWERNGAIIPNANSAVYVATTPGTYRARFSRVPNPSASDWNKWSNPVTVSERNPARAALEQIGTVLLKDLNNFGDLRLKAEGEFAHYYWYKDGTLLNILDTTSQPVIKPGNCTGTCTGNGVYTLVTADYDNCPSPPSLPKHVFFNNQAPLNISAPANFAASIPNETTIRLTWEDKSGNENGFEIWRRKVISGTTFSKWEMRVLTAANVISYNDGDIEPSTTYHYKIRAAGNTGRSDYTPAASNTYLVITTAKDNTIPTPPGNLTAQSTGINTITLTWQASTDNTGIRQYRITYGAESILTGSSRTSYTINDLNLNTIYTFSVRAEDLGGNLSSAVSATANTYVSGLFYEHSTGAWKDLDEIDWTIAEFKGKVKNFTLAPKTQDDYFNFKYDGYLYITTGGSYVFQTISSDGSRLELDGVVIVDNDGVHHDRPKASAPIELTPGPKRITVKFFEYEDGESLRVNYKGPDSNNGWKAIPDAALRSGDVTPTESTIASARGAEDDPAAGEALHTVTVFPNPTSSQNINVKLESNDEATVYLKLVDFTGRQIYEGEFRSEEIKEGVRIAPSEIMLDGIYLLRMHVNGKSATHRISVKN